MEPWTRVLTWVLDLVVGELGLDSTEIPLTLSLYCICNLYYRYLMNQHITRLFVGDLEYVCVCTVSQEVSKLCECDFKGTVIVSYLLNVPPF